MSKETLVILYGGRSAEREVSVMSATNVIRAVDYHKYQVKTYFITKEGDFVRGATFVAKPAADFKLMDNKSVGEGVFVAPSDIYEKSAIVFPVLHGPQGEDGSIQGFLEVIKMAYVGPSVLFAAATMDKILSKEVFAQLDIPQVPYVAMYPKDAIEEIIEKVNVELTYPVFVKPANMGSSVGISKVDATENLKDALEEALKYDNRIVIEQGLVNPHEVECAVLGNDDVQVTFPGEVSNSGDFYDYKEKYLNGAVTIDVPAKISVKIIEQIRRYAEMAYKGIAGQGLSRCDFFVSADEKNVYLNEINAIPGFTAFSMYPMLWENQGLSTTELITKLIELGREVFKLREQHLEN